MNTIFRCVRCGFESKHKHVLSRHLTRTRPCKPTILDVCQEAQVNYKDNTPIQMSAPVTVSSHRDLTISEPSTISGHLTHSDSYELNKVNELQCPTCSHVFSSRQKKNQHKCKGPLEDRLKCHRCSKKFSDKSNLNRHLKSCKKEKNPTGCEDIEKMQAQIQDKDDIIKALKDELLKCKTDIASSWPPHAITNNTTNNNTTNNNTTNIIILTGYGNENVEHILQNKDLLLDKIAHASGSSVDFYTQAFKAIYFNPEYPENQNFKMTNSRGNLVTVTKKNEHGELYENSEDQARFFPKVLCDVQKFIKDGRKNMKKKKLQHKVDNFEREMKECSKVAVPLTYADSEPRPLAQIAQMEKQRDMYLKAVETVRKKFVQV